MTIRQLRVVNQAGHGPVSPAGDLPVAIGVKEMKKIRDGVFRNPGKP